MDHRRLVERRHKFAEAENRYSRAECGDLWGAGSPLTRSAISAELGRARRPRRSVRCSANQGSLGRGDRAVGCRRGFRALGSRCGPQSRREVEVFGVRAAQQGGRYRQPTGTKVRSMGTGERNLAPTHTLGAKCQTGPWAGLAYKWLFLTETGKPCPPAPEYRVGGPQGANRNLPD